MQVLASRGLGTVFRKFPAANANEGPSLLLKSNLHVQICPPAARGFSLRLNPWLSESSEPPQPAANGEWSEGQESVSPEPAWDDLC